MYIIIAAISQDYLLKNKDFDIRLVVSCCFIEIILLFSPEDPFSSDDLKIKVLDLFSNTIVDKINATGSTLKRITHLITKFDDISAHIIFADLDKMVVEKFLESLSNFIW